VTISDWFGIGLIIVTAGYLGWKLAEAFIP